MALDLEHKLSMLTVAIGIIETFCFFPDYVEIDGFFRCVRSAESRKRRWSVSPPSGGVFVVRELLSRRSVGHIRVQDHICLVKPDSDSPIGSKKSAE